MSALSTSSSRFTLKPMAYALAAVLCSSALPLAKAWAQYPAASSSQTQQQYDIAAGSLGSVLSQFASQANIVLSFDANLTQGYSSQGLHGSYDVAAGFAAILQGQPFSLKQIANNQYQLLAATNNNQLALQPVTVTAQQQLGQTSEGSGSYTTGAMGTATKMPMSIRETPQSISIMSRQQMDDLHMSNITDVVQSTPGLFLSTGSGPGRPEFMSRGFSLDSVMYDGLPSSYQGWVISTQANMAMFDRVEVVRGATGLVTGSGTPSAAINLVRKRPTLEPQVIISGDVGRWDDYRGEFDASSALNEEGTVRGRIVTSYRDAGTFRDGEAHDNGLLYLIGEVDLTERTTLALGFSEQKDSTNLFWGGLPLTADGQHMDLPRSTNPANDWERKKQDLVTVFADLTHRFENDWNMRLAASKSWQDGLFRGTYLDRNSNGLGHSVYQSKHWEKQTAFDGSFSGPFSLFQREHELVVGGSWRQNNMTTYEYDNAGRISSNIDLPNWDNGSIAKPNFSRTGKNRQISTEQGVYVTSRFSIADPLKVIIGGRLDWYEVEGHGKNKQGPDSNYKITRNLTRYAGLIYELNDNHSVYASYTDIFTPQSKRDTSGKLLNPMTGENYEVGIKGEYFAGALNASASVFRIDQKDRAKAIDDQRLCPTYPSQSCYDSAGLVRSEGFELELQGALSENWQMSAGYTYISAEYKKDADPSKVGRSFSSNMPTRLFKVATVYNLPNELNRWRVGGNIYWQNRMYYDASHDGLNYRVQQKAYAVAGLMLGYKPTENLDLQLNVSNIFDKKYYQGIASDIRWGSTDNYGEPRSFHLTGRYTF